MNTNLHVVHKHRSSFALNRRKFIPTIISMVLIILISTSFQSKAVIGEALHFDGTSDYIDLGTAFGNFGTADFTVETWFKTTAANGTLIGKRGICGHDNFWNITLSAGHVACELDQSTSGTNYISLSSPGLYNDGLWHHVAITRVGVAVKLYVDGILVSSGNSLATTNLTNAISLKIGAAACSTFGGTLDETRIWSRALSACEISYYRTCEIATTSTGLVANYHYNQGTVGASNTSITTLTDATGTGHTGTLATFTLSGAISNWVGSGAVASGISCVAGINFEINVAGNLTSIPDGTTAVSTANFTDFGTSNSGGVSSRTFVIQNTGTNILEIDSVNFSNITAGGAFAISGISLPLNLAAGSSTSFVVTSTPTSSGIKTATVNIYNSDCDEGLYNFNIQSNSLPGQCIHLDGINDMVDCGTATSLDITKGTWEAWVKTSNTSLTQRIFFKQLDNTTAAGMYELYYNSVNQKFMADIKVGGTNYQVTSTTSPVANTWYHVAATYDGQDFRIFVNGILENTNSSPSGLMDPGTGNLTIGKALSIAVNNWVGNIDEARVWNRALTPCEISFYKSCEVPSSLTGLILAYHFNQGVANLSNTTNTSVTDASPLANNGTLINLALTGSTSNWTFGGAITSGTSCGTFVAITGSSSVSSCVNYTWNGTTYTTSGVYTGTFVSSGFCDSIHTLTLTINPIPTIGGTATPASVCMGSNVTLNGTGGVNYTWSNGVVNGTPFAQSTTSTYTVSGTDANGCVNTATILVNSIPLPTLYNATVSPNPICFGANSTITYNPGCTGNQTGFAGTFAPANWTSTTTGNSNGTIAVAGTPTVMTMVSSNGLSGSASTNWTITPTCNGIISFNWNYSTIDGAQYDYPRYAINGGSPNLFPGYNTFGASTQSGTASISVNAGQSFQLQIYSTDNALGSCTVTISNFKYSTQNITWYSAATGGTNLGTGYSLTVTTPTSGNHNYYAEVQDATTLCTNSVRAVSDTLHVNALPIIGINASSTNVCLGSSVTLNGTGASTYTWSSGISDSVAFTPSATSTYTVTGTDVNGCVNTATKTITSLPLPVLNTVTSSPNPICIGASSTVTYNLPCPTQTNFAGAFAPANWVTSVTGNSNGTITPSVGGDTLVMVSSNGLSGSGATNWTITTACKGLITFNWDYTTVDGSNWDYPRYSVNGGALTLLPGYSTSGSTIQSGTASIPVNAGQTFLLQIYSVDNFVGSCTAKITNFNFVAQNFTWYDASTGGTNLGTTPSISVTPTTSGTKTYYVEVQDPATLCVNSTRASGTLLVNPLPNVSITSSADSLCIGGSLTLSGAGASTYVWGGSVVNGVAFTQNATTTYSVTGTDANGCVNTATKTIGTVPYPTLGTATASPNVLCLGGSTTLTYILPSGANQIGFAGEFAPSNWTVGTIGNSNGTINSSSAPSSIVMTSSNQAPGYGNGATYWEITPTTSGKISFNWNYTSPDGSNFDYARYSINGGTFNPLPGYVQVGGTSNQSGSASIPVTSGQVFHLDIFSLDNILGSCTVTISNFKFIGQTVNWYDLAIGGTSLDSINPFTITPTTAGSKTYYAQVKDAKWGCVNPTRVASNTINVRPLPTLTPTATPAAVCPNGQSFLTSGYSGNYCTPTASGGVTGDFISNFNFNTGAINVSSGDVASNYTYVATPLASVVAGNTYPFAITTGGVNFESRAVWVDFNQDGDFDDANEFAWVSPNANSSLMFGTITIPTNATNGILRMRVACQFATTITSTQSCGITSFGEFEDYRIQVTGGTGTTAASIVWSPTTYLGGSNLSQTLATGIISAQTYTITATDAFGCSTTSTLPITMSTSVTGGVFGSVAPLPACQGSNITLTGSGATNYLWSLNGSAYSNGVPFQTNIAGTFFYTVTGINATNACVGSNTVVSVVNPSPTINITSTPSNAIICNTGNVGLLATGGSSYTWSPTTSLSSSTTASTTASPTSTTIYTVTVSDGICSATKTKTVEFSSNPFISTVTATPTSPCVGGSTTLNTELVKTAMSNLGPSLTIPLVGNATPFPAVLNVSGLNSQMTVKKVYINGINHTYEADIDMWLMNPQGQIVMLLSDCGNGNDFINTNLIFTDSLGATNAGVVSNVVSGTYRPANQSVNEAGEPLNPSTLLSTFTGNPNGNWQLFVNDDVNIDQGSIASFNIEFEDKTPYTYSWGATPLSSVAGISSPTNASTNAIVNATTNYNVTVTNVNGCSTTGNVNVVVTPCNTSLNLKLYIQGYYDAATNMMNAALFNQGVSLNTNETDSIDVELHDATTYSLISTVRTILHTDGTAICNFPPVTGNYYVAIKHRNAIQTWSSNPITIGPATANYDFSTAANKAYGDNQVEVVSGVWALYSGEINLDENIDLLDIGLVETDISNFEYGYKATDINGDGNVDLLDSPVVETNVNSFIFSAHP